jgi:hypothetical protein
MKTAVMKTLKQFMMISVFVFLASLTAFAQKDQKKDPPPKDNPPKVVAPDKQQKPPKDNDRPPRNNDDRNKPRKP